MMPKIRTPLMLILMLCVLSGSAFAANITDKNAVLAIIGEAENQGKDGMLAVACAIRNRGTLKGVYGTKNPRVVKKLYSNKIYLMAEKAWNDSRAVDVTNGATHWENIKAFGKPYWVASMRETYRLKDHVFYKK